MCVCPHSCIYVCSSLCVMLKIFISLILLAYEYGRNVSSLPCQFNYPVTGWWQNVVSYIRIISDNYVCTGYCDCEVDVSIWVPTMEWNWSNWEEPILPPSNHWNWEQTELCHIWLIPAAHRILSQVTMKWPELLVTSLMLYGMHTHIKCTL